MSAHAPMAAHRVLVGLVCELRPDLPWPLVDSLVAEALDRAAVEILDESWARAREHLYAEAVAAARTRHHIGYAERRVREVADAAPRAGDYPGRALTKDGRVVDPKQVA